MRTDLIVIYTDRLDACRTFYTGIGLDFAAERHGDGPEHYAAELDGCVFELYPSGERRPATGPLRLGLTAPAHDSVEDLTPGRHTLTDPDGRTVVLTVPGEPETTERGARAAVARLFGETARADITALAGGDLSITLASGGRTAVIEGRPESGWSWTLTPERPGSTAPGRTADTLDSAFADVHAAMTGRPGRTGGDEPRG
ncbi:glyoxalase/bleomycin resistance/dioxygenase family protein [Streptomyces sp. NPDC014894]|uniref:glyoxalase/bleomycin resistance/dioxygenase family protein n=1 Tax=Streptomyces sp. NPDC014894 TaxID=3364931 RepID=UPI0036FE63F3